MTAEKKRGGDKPPSPAALIDVSDRWRLFLAKRAEIEEIFRTTLDLAPDANVSRAAQPFAMAALPPLPPPEPRKGQTDPSPFGPPPARVTEQKMRRDLLRIERSARGVLKDKPRKDAFAVLRRAIDDAAREVKAALPGAVVLAAMLPDEECNEPVHLPPGDAIARVASEAGAIAATIPQKKHPGGRRAARTDETALAVLLAQSFEALTGRAATPNNFDLDDYATSAPSPFMLLAERVFSVTGLPGSARKAAERAVEHLKASRSTRNEITNE